PRSWASRRTLTSCCAALAVVLLACADSPAGLTDPEAPVTGPAIAASMSGGCNQGEFVTFTVQWNCNTTVRLHPTTTFLGENLDGPVGAWDDAIQATGRSPLPRFETTTNASLASATVTGVNGGTAFCGNWDTPSKTLTIVNETDSNCATNNNRDGIQEILTHEMAHVWGWAGGANTGHNEAIAGVSDHCTLALQQGANAGVNTNICAHNIEGGLAAYGLRTLPSQSATFWSTPFVIGHNGSGAFSAVTLVEGGSDTLNLGQFVLERDALITGAWSRSSSNPAVATMSSSGVITAGTAGTATITVTPQAVSGAFLTSQFAGSSRTVSVTVNPAPLTVTNISINAALPLTAAGSYEWTATLAGSSAGVTYRWVFEYSDTTPPDSIFIPARLTGDVTSPWIATSGPGQYVGAGAKQTRAVHHGNYTIWVKVWPIRDGVAGSPAVREFSVCTQTGENLMANTLLGSLTSELLPPENEAVQGCPPS
ncbi:MAG: hypothetical protein KC544_12795, partial [Gemmatimonadetes bacterium]|nr:hypothetical protein [Gemmatimonadota bacterium]